MASLSPEQPFRKSLLQRPFSFVSGACLTAAVLMCGASAGFAQTTLSPEEQARLAAADEGGGDEAELVLPFEDPFDGGALGDQWKVVNEDKDFHVTEDGKVLAITTGGKDGFLAESGRNIFTLQSLPPEGDFDMSITGRLDPKTGYDDIWLGLRESAGNFIGAHLYVYTKGCGPSMHLDTVANQPIGPDMKPVQSAARHNLFDGPVIDNICSKGGRAIGDQILKVLSQKGFVLTLSRRGLRYRSSLELDLPDRGKNRPAGLSTARTDWLARFARFGRPAFMVGQAQKAGGGETLAEFEHFSIKAPQQ